MIPFMKLRLIILNVNIYKILILAKKTNYELTKDATIVENLYPRVQNFSPKK